MWKKNKTVRNLKSMIDARAAHARYRTRLALPHAPFLPLQDMM